MKKCAIGRTWGIVGAVVLAAGLPASADEIRGIHKMGEIAPAMELTPAARQLLADFPGVSVQAERGVPVVFSGKTMTRAATADDAVARWLTAYKGAFGVSDLRLTLRRVDSASMGRFTVFEYGQVVGGIPVELSTVIFVVLNEGASHAVVSASAKIARPAAGGMDADTIDAGKAFQIATTDLRVAQIKNWVGPEMVVFFGEGDLRSWVPARRAWVFVGEDMNPANPQKFRVFVDAANGDVLAVRNEILHADVTGTVRANATPGLRADSASNPPTLQPVPEVKVQYAGGNPNQFTLTNGTFNFVNGAAGTLDTSLAPGYGRWTQIVDNSGTPIVAASSAATPGTPVTLTLNPTPAEFTTAQVNAYIHATNTYRFIKTRAPSYTNLDALLPSNVNLTSTCNAFYNGTSINFYRVGGGCNNTAFSTVVAHEYGHHIVNRRGLAQNAFGEGFSDCVAILMYDTGIVGQDFTTSGGAVRNPAGANQQYPCTATAIHTCGQILGGSWYETRVNMGTRYPDGLERTRQLFVDWHLITLGEIDSLNSAGPRTAREVLTVDDNDGNLLNGTPNSDLICNAFAQHGIQCPTYSFGFPSGQPSIIAPNVPAPVVVSVTVDGAAPTPGSLELRYRVNGGSFLAVPLTPSGGINYTASIPGQSCGSSVDWYVIGGSVNGTVVSPAGAPANFYSAFVASGTTAIVNDTMETDAGWTVGAPGDTATSGIWNRMDPQQTTNGGAIAQPGDDTTPAPGVNCWVTDGNAGASAGTFDVDNGATTLTSPVYNLSGYTNVVISYNRWYYIATTLDDSFRVRISGDNGGTWQDLDVVSPNSAQARGGWFRPSFRISNPALLTNQARLRFIATDTGASGAGASLLEAAVDDLLIEGLVCNTCRVDLNNDGIADFNDYLEFLNLFNANNPAADFNNDGIVDFNDYLEFLNLYNIGC